MSDFQPGIYQHSDGRTRRVDTKAAAVAAVFDGFKRQSDAEAESSEVNEVSTESENTPTPDADSAGETSVDPTLDGSPSQDVYDAPLYDFDN